MEETSLWSRIHSTQRRQLPFDVEHCSPIALRNILLDVCTPADMLERIAHVYYDDDHIARDLIRCPNLAESTLVFLALTTSEEIKQFITSTRVVDVVMEEDAAAAAEAAREQKAKKKLNMSQIVKDDPFAEDQAGTDRRQGGAGPAHPGVEQGHCAGGDRQSQNHHR
jgi:hypothetical protein